MSRLITVQEACGHGGLGPTVELYARWALANPSGWAWVKPLNDALAIYGLYLGDPTLNPVRALLMGTSAPIYGNFTRKPIEPPTLAEQLEALYPKEWKKNEQEKSTCTCGD